MRFLLLLVACGDDVTNMQMTADLSAAVDMAKEEDLAVGVPDLAQANVDLLGADLSGAPDLAPPVFVDMTVAKKRVFVTSGTFTGDLKTNGSGTDGLNGGDKLCQMAATTAGLGGTWVAWLSDSTHDAKDRVADVGPWYRLDGMMVFANKAALTGHPMVAINLTENNAMATGLSTLPFTGTDNGGTKDANVCTDWTSTAGNGEAGLATSTLDAWTQSAPLHCNIGYSLYCFEQ